MTENKVFIAEQETLLEVKEQTEKLIRNLIPTDAPIYGMVIHEASDLNPATRVEYLGANKDFKPMSMNMAIHGLWLLGRLELVKSECAGYVWVGWRNQILSESG